MNRIRNFSIIAHIDHGKSTLADRLLELTGTIEKRKMKEQMLDSMDLERERGITIKMQPVRMIWKARNPKSETRNNIQAQNPKSFEFRDSNLEFSNSEYILNLIDTPGHVDFSYEVSRALACCEGAILLVDATQGVEAQTLSHFFLAKKLGLKLIPVINKIDLAHARVEEVERELIELAGFDSAGIRKVSAKDGTGVDDLLHDIVEKIPPPKSDLAQLRALVFDSFFESHKGVVAYVRVVDGSLKKGDSLWLSERKSQFVAREVGYITPALVAEGELGAGEVGYIITGVKEPGEVRVGDTIFRFQDKTLGIPALPGYLEPKPVVWASFFPTDQGDFYALGDALSKLKLNDSSLVFEEKSSAILGRGYECGFLGTLHLEVSSERLRREFNIAFVVTHPSVTYRVTRGDRIEYISSAASFPQKHEYQRAEELWMRLEIIAPQNGLADGVKTIEAFEGVVGDIKVIGGLRLTIEAKIPLRQMVSGFFDALKSATHGYASYSYEESGWQDADLTQIELLVAGDSVEALSRVVRRDSALREARKIVERVKSVLPQELFVVKIQAVIEGRIVASESIKALRKDVTGYLYGGDRSRKMKLWKKQKEGKKCLQENARVTIKPETYLKLINIDR